jgi:hypothetical protein
MKKRREERVNYPLYIVSPIGSFLMKLGHIRNHRGPYLRHTLRGFRFLWLYSNRKKKNPKIEKWVRIRIRTKRKGRIALVPPLPWLTSILTTGTNFVNSLSVSLFTLSFSLITSSSSSSCCFRDERFSNEEHYEWFKEYSHFRHLIQAHIKPTSSVLPPSLSLDLYVVCIFGFSWC